MAGRIAAGEPIRMPDIGNNELGQLGQAINGMADILRHQASIDMLTGLYNLRHLTDRLEDLLVEARERGEPLALLVCDLDNLKPVNDTHGHHVGDLLLRAVARELLAWCNVAYTCWRTGGDEFAAVIPGADLERARREVDALQQAINGRTIPVPGGQIPISLSIGIATYPADGTTGSALMEVADQRMYESKSHKVKPGMPAPAA
jgi:diguanylate cyclase (GGDEF)-like protein